MSERDDTAIARRRVERMVREEIVVRPARRAAAFCALVALALGTAGLADGADPRDGFEIRAEIRR